MPGRINSRSIIEEALIGSLFSSKIAIDTRIEIIRIMRKNTWLKILKLAVIRDISCIYFILNLESKFMQNPFFLKF